jgi:hypothetical protein
MHSQHWCSHACSCNEKVKHISHITGWLQTVRTHKQGGRCGWGWIMDITRLADWSFHLRWAVTVVVLGIGFVSLPASLLCHDPYCPYLENTTICTVAVPGLTVGFFYPQQLVQGNIPWLNLHWQVKCKNWRTRLPSFRQNSASPRPRYRTLALYQLYH